jgi:hypothetical protein
MRDSRAFGALRRICPFASIGRSRTVVDLSGLTRWNADVTHGVARNGGEAPLDEQVGSTHVKQNPIEPKSIARAMSRTDGDALDRRMSQPLAR